MEPKPSINASRKRPLSADHSVHFPKFGTPINHRVPVIKATGRPPPLPAAARESSRVEVGGVQPPVPDAAPLGPEVPQVDNVISQPNPEETPVEPPPLRKSGLGLNPEILDRINGYASISVTRAVPKAPSEPPVVKNPQSMPIDASSFSLPVLEEMKTIINKYKHLWSHK